MADVLPTLFLIAVGLCLALVLLALYRSLHGLLAHSAGTRVARAPGSGRRAALLREKEELLAAIRELRFEHDLGKVSEQDFGRLDQRYRARAKEVLRELDEQIAPHRERARAMLEGAVGVSAGADAGETGTGTGTGSGSGSGTGAAPGVGADREAGGVACGKCATRNDADALFCKRCANALRAEAKA